MMILIYVLYDHYDGIWRLVICWKAIMTLMLVIVMLMMMMMMTNISEYIGSARLDAPFQLLEIPPAVETQ